MESAFSKSQIDWTFLILFLKIHFIVKERLLIVHGRICWYIFLNFSTKCGSWSQVFQSFYFERYKQRMLAYLLLLITYHKLSRICEKLLLNFCGYGPSIWLETSEHKEKFFSGQKSWMEKFNYCLIWKKKVGRAHFFHSEQHGLSASKDREVITASKSGNRLTSTVGR